MASQEVAPSLLHVPGRDLTQQGLHRRSLRRSQNLSGAAGPSLFESALSAAARRRIERSGWERSQKRTYTNWLNYHLRAHPNRQVPPIEDIERDLCDGTRLCYLIEVLMHESSSGASGKLPKVWDPVSLPKDKFKALENGCIFIQAFQSLFPACKMSSTLGPQDIVDGNYTLIMGLLWKMILVVQMDVNDLTALSSADPDMELLAASRLHSQQQQQQQRDEEEERKSGDQAAQQHCSPAETSSSQQPGERKRSVAAQAQQRPRVRTLAFAQANLLEWVQSRVESYDLSVSNFTDCFADGKVFQALVASIDAGYRYEHETTQDPHRNMTSAFGHLDRQLDIPQLLSADDMVGACSPDQRSVMTYLSVIHSKYRDAPIVRHSLSATATAADARDADSSDSDSDSDNDDELNLHIALKGRGLKTGVVGAHNVFTISVLNTASGEIIPSGDALFIELISAERSEHVLVFSQSSNADGSSVYSYIPTAQDRQLTLSVWHYDALVTTLTIAVVDAAAAAAAVSAVQLRLGDVPSPLCVGEPARFTVLGLDDLSLSDIAEHLTIVVDGPHSQVAVTSSVSESKTLIAGFVPVEVGPHVAYLYYDGQLQHQVAVDAVLDDRNRSAASHTDDAALQRRIDADAPDYNAYLLIGCEASFDVSVKNSAGSDTRFRVIGPDSIVIVPAVLWHGEDEFTVSYTPHVEGEYLLETYSGTQRQRLQPVFASHRLPASASPLSPRSLARLSSSSSSSSSSSVAPSVHSQRVTAETLQTVPLHATMEEETHVLLSDPDQPSLPWPAAVESTRLVDPCGEPVDHCIDNGVLSFRPKLPGVHTFQFQRSQAVAFETLRRIAVDMPDPVFVHLPSRRCVVGLEASFTVGLRSAPGVPPPSGDLEIFIDGPQGRIPCTVDVSEEGYLCRYIPDTAGEFTIRVFLDGNEIRLCTVVAVATEVGKTIHLGHVCKLDIQMRSQPGAPPPIHVSVCSPSGDTVPAVVDTSAADGACSITFLPREPGVYTLSCAYENTETAMPAILAVPAHCELPDDEPAPQKTLAQRGGRRNRLTALRQTQRMSQTFNARSSVRRLGASPAATFAPAPPPPVPLPPPPCEIPDLSPMGRSRGASTAERSRPVSGVEVRALSAVQTSQSFRLWLGCERLEKLLGLENAFKTFTLSRTLTTEELRQQMIDTISKGRPAELVHEIQRIVRDDAYCICEQPLYGDESTCRRLFRSEVIMEVISRMRQTENQIKTVSSVSSKLSERKVQKQLERCSAIITQENAKFLATQAHRLYVTVREVLALDSSVTSLACSVSVNAQKFRTETVRVDNGVARFNADMTFGVNTLQNVVMTLRISEAVPPRELGSVQIPLDQLLVLPTWDTVFPLAGHRQGHSTMAGSAHVTLEYAPNEAVPKVKLSQSQIDAFCRSQPCRLLVSVLQVEELFGAAAAELLDIYYRVDYNRQFRKSAVRRASTCPQWAGERLPIGVAQVLPDAESLRISFRAKKRKDRQLARLLVPLDQLQPNHELIGWFPLVDAAGLASASGRALVSVEFLVEGAWSTETLGRLYFRPAPKFYLQINVVYPRQRMKVGERLRIQVKVRDLQNNRALTDDLQGGELEIKVQTPSGAVLYVPAHKDYPHPQEGLFYIDFVPREVGVYTSMLKYNDQDMQHRFCHIKVRASHQRQSVFHVSVN